MGLHRTLQEILVNHSRRIPQIREKIIALNGEPPLGLLDTDLGARLIEEILGRLEHGVVG